MDHAASYTDFTPVAWRNSNNVKSLVMQKPEAVPFDCMSPIDVISRAFQHKQESDLYELATAPCSPPRPSARYF